MKLSVDAHEKTFLDGVGNSRAIETLPIDMSAHVKSFPVGGHFVRFQCHCIWLLFSSYR